MEYWFVIEDGAIAGINGLMILTAVIATLYFFCLYLMATDPDLSLVAGFAVTTITLAALIGVLLTFYLLIVYAPILAVFLMLAGAFLLVGRLRILGGNLYDAYKKEKNK